MNRSNTPRRKRAAIAAAGVAALAAVGGGSALAAGEAQTAAKAVSAPYTKRCAIDLRAYEDGSANLFCAKREKPFASVDAESGRIRFYR